MERKIDDTFEYQGKKLIVEENNNGSCVGCFFPEISKTILPSEQAAEAHLAYMQLHQLRNAWREGWTPDWMDNTQAKFAIIYNKNEHIVFDCRFINRFLSFQDEARATEFLQCYKSLIKKAGDLI